MRISETSNGSKWNKDYIKLALHLCSDIFFFFSIAIYHFCIFVIFISAFLTFHTDINKDKIDLNHDYSARVRRNIYLGECHT